MERHQVSPDISIHIGIIATSTREIASGPNPRLMGGQRVDVLAYVDQGCIGTIDLTPVDHDNTIPDNRFNSAVRNEKHNDP
ncbi:hypothetical protein, partial [Staphylococcus aureus]|uniref:hypothetical protein n=1 Tax=Staphylococcus aureus TaxID=1280 RepID=UPI001C528CFB